MSVSATYRPPYWPKCPCSSGSLGAADELLDLRIILPSPALLDAPGDVHAERPPPPDQPPRGVHEDPEERRPGDRRGDLAGARQVHGARASGPEVEAQEIRPGARGRACVLHAADAADLDLHGHASHSAKAAPGSGRSMKASPTRTACAPARRIRSTSVRERMPLSATTRTPAGTSAASRSVVSSETVKLARSRLLIPMSVAPAASAHASSTSP